MTGAEASMGGHFLSLAIFLPAAAGLASLACPDKYWRWARLWAAMVALGEILLAVLAACASPAVGGLRLVEKTSWIPAYGITYHLGLDGLGLTMFLVTAGIFAAAVITPYDGVSRRRGAFYACLLLLESAVLGVFASLDLVLFYLFWEAMLIPAYFLVGLWGGTERIRAAVIFVMYTLAGSLLMLIGLAVVYAGAGGAESGFTFSLSHMISIGIPPHIQKWTFFLFLAALAVKTPLLPLHGWLRPTYYQTATPVTMVFSGILAKMGVFGMLRFLLPLFPDAARQWAPGLAVLSLAGVIYGAFLALGQNDLKLMAAYSSMSHMGLIALGIFSLTADGGTGAVIQMVSHALISSGLFVVAAALRDVGGSFAMNPLRPMFGPMPRATAAAVFFALAGLGLPGTSAFIGEFLIVAGTFRWSLMAGFAACLGIALGAFYLLRMLGRVFFAAAPLHAESPRKGDAAMSALLPLLPLAAVVIIIGLFPGPLADLVRPGIIILLEQLGIL